METLHASLQASVVSDAHFCARLHACKNGCLSSGNTNWILFL